VGAQRSAFTFSARLQLGVRMRVLPDMCVDVSERAHQGVDASLGGIHFLARAVASFAGLIQLALEAVDTRPQPLQPLGAVVGRRAARKYQQAGERRARDDKSAGTYVRQWLS
jgi:hypothetical protein